MQMRRSKVLEKLRAGEIVNCFKLNLSDPRVAEIAGLCGADCVWLDNEHVPTDPSAMENQIRAAKAYDTDALVRVARGPYSDYVVPLEADATGIMVPHVMTADDARAVVRQSRFHPQGRRPVDGGNSDGMYTMLDFNEYIKSANEQRFIALQIEDPEAMDELDEILAVEGFDIIFFGPGDFSHAIGQPGNPGHKDVQDAIKKVGAAAKKAGKFAGIPSPPEKIEAYRQLGYQFFATGADVIAVGSYMKEKIAAFNEVAGSK